MDASKMGESGGLPKKSAIPLAPLVEQSETRPKLKSNTLIQSEPSALHFSGFQLGRDYQQVLKLINVSSEVINIHIIPTQTKYFHTKYEKKQRLVPGLCYFVKVHFCPDEWRYFYDCIRVHSQGEENLLVPVHAYPVINDLDIPSHISLPPVPLGQSIHHIIPLSCSCPVDFEFQLCLIQSHRAFSVEPLSGVIPANGQMEIVVTFTPFEYGTAQITLQLIISQFNSKPYLCTISGMSSLDMAIHHQGKYQEKKREPNKHVQYLHVASMANLCKAKRKQKPTGIIDSHDSGTQCSETLLVVSSPATVAKVLIQKGDRLPCKEIHQEWSQRVVNQTRQVKESIFEKKVHQDFLEERTNHQKWQVHLGKEPISPENRNQILQQREIAGQLEMQGKSSAEEEEDFTRRQPCVSSIRVPRHAGQLQTTVPLFPVCSKIMSLDVKNKVIALFQQAARKVVISCRMNRMLASLRSLVCSMKSESITVLSEEKERFVQYDTGDVKTDVCLKLSEEKIQPFMFPDYTNHNDLDELHFSTLKNPANLPLVPVMPVEVHMQPQLPLFKLQVPQHYKLMGYEQISVYQAWTSYIPKSLDRPLRSGAQDELLLAESSLQQEQPQVVTDEESYGLLSFKPPAALLQSPYAHPLMVFNPAPGLHAFKPRLAYLECDLDFHLCPLPKYPLARGATTMAHADTQRKFLDHKDIIKGVLNWKMIPLAALTTLPSIPTLSSSTTPQVCDPFNTDLLTATLPPAMDSLSDELKDLLDELSENTGVSFTPEMIRAQFLVSALSPSPKLAAPQESNI